MQYFDFYKGIYERELHRRKELDEAVSIPIGVLALLLGLISFFYTSDQYGPIINGSWFALTVLILAVTALVSCILFLIISYNNLFRGFNYRNLALLKEIRIFQKVTIPEFNSKVEESQKMSFEDELVVRLIDITDHNTSINDSRSYNMYIARTSLSVALALILVSTIYVIIKHSIS